MPVGDMNDAGIFGSDMELAYGESFSKWDGGVKVVSETGVYRFMGCQPCFSPKPPVILWRQTGAGLFAPIYSGAAGIICWH